MSALSEVAAALDPALRTHAIADLPQGRYDHLEPNLGFVLEAVWEGYLVHYGRPRLFPSGVHDGATIDPDLRLLAGDALYALGLERLAESGDLAAVGVLADLISSTARAEAADDRESVAGLWEEHVSKLAQPA